MSLRVAWRRAFARSVSRGKPRHHLDRIEPMEIEGWGVGAVDDDVVDVDVREGRKALPVDVERVPRPDVASALQLPGARPYGIRVGFGPAYWRERLAHDRTGALPPLAARLLLDGHEVLPITAPGLAELSTWFDGVVAAEDGAKEHLVLLALAALAAVGKRAAPSPATRLFLESAATARGLREALDDDDAHGAIALARATQVALDDPILLGWVGWAFAGPEAIETFEVAVGHRREATAAVRVDRPDVAASLSTTRSQVGFVCPVPPTVWRHADAAGGCEFALQVNGCVVPGSRQRLDAAGLQAAYESLRGSGDSPRFSDWPVARLLGLRAPLRRVADHLAAAAQAGCVSVELAERALGEARDVEAATHGRGLRSSEAGALRWHLEAGEDLTFYGWARDAVADDEIFVLSCEGRPVAARVLRVSRGDVAAALRVPRQDLGFSIAVPATVWKMATAADGGDRAGPRAVLALSINGREVVRDVVLDRAAVERALCRASDALRRAPASDASARFARRRWLDVMSHVEALGGEGLLGEPARRALEGARARLAIEDPLETALDVGADDALRGAGGTPEQRLAARVATLQKRFNRMLDEQTPAEALERLLADAAADPQARQVLLFGLVPFACEHGLFDRLRGTLGVDAARRFVGDSGDAWRRSLLVAFLGEEGDDGLEEAASELAGLAASGAPGWLNTECVGQAVAAACRPGVRPAAREAVARAFGALVNRLADDPWSRAHDRHLRGAAIRLVRAPFEGPLRGEVDDAILRACAMQPGFWRDLDAGAEPVERQAVQSARRDVDDAARAFAAAADVAGAALPAALAALRRLVDRGWPDAAFWLRALASSIHRLPPAGEQLDTLAAMLAALDEADPLRLAASPWRPDGSGQAQRQDAALRAATAWQGPGRADAGAGAAIRLLVVLAARAEDATGDDDAHTPPLDQARAQAAALQAAGVEVRLALPSRDRGATEAHEDADMPGAGGVPILRLPALESRRAGALARWALERAGETRVAYIAGTGVLRLDEITALRSDGRDFVGWPARLQAPLLRARSAALPIASRRTGWALSHEALRVLARAEEVLMPEAASRIAGLDADERLAQVLADAGIELSAAPRLLARPGVLDAEHPKLWPVSGPARLETTAGSNVLVLESPPERVARADRAPVLVVAVARNERELLPHFLGHYRALGAQAFVIVDNGSDDGSVPYLAAQDDVVLYSTDTEYRLSHFGVAWQEAVLAAHAAGRWALVADLDEFLVLPAGGPQHLDDYVAALDALGASAAEIHMVDMYPRGGLAEARLDRDAPFAAAPCHDVPPLRPWHLGSGYYSCGATWLSALRHRLVPDAPPNAFTSQKIALLRHGPWVRLAEGLHYASGLDVSPLAAHFAHFKYHGRFLEKVEDEIRRMQHYEGAAEYRRYLDMREACTRGFHDVDATVCDAPADGALPHWPGVDRALAGVRESFVRKGAA